MQAVEGERPGCVSANRSGVTSHAAPVRRRPARADLAQRLSAPGCDQASQARVRREGQAGRRRRARSGRPRGPRRSAASTTSTRPSWAATRERGCRPGRRPAPAPGRAGRRRAGGAAPARRRPGATSIGVLALGVGDPGDLAPRPRRRRTEHARQPGPHAGVSASAAGRAVAVVSQCTVPRTSTALARPVRSAARSPTLSPAADAGAAAGRCAGRPGRPRAGAAARRAPSSSQRSPCTC